MERFFSHPPRIGLIGYGKMGREIESIAGQFGITVSAIIDTNLDGRETVINARTLARTDVCIEFTQPAAVVENIRAIALARKAVVVGTTGWNSHLPEVREIVTDAGIGLVHASNFSIGMHLFQRIVRKAGELFRSHAMYDCFIHEAHHAQKRDAPSGTALRLADILMELLPGKRRVVTGDLKDVCPEDGLHVSSSRGGAVPGTHTVTFDSIADSIELRHTARSRRGFAEGALFAAAWVRDKKGIFTMEDVLDDLKSI